MGLKITRLLVGSVYLFKCLLHVFVCLFVRLFAYICS